MVERIQIVVGQRGARTVRRDIEGIGTGALSSNSAVQLLRRTLLTAFVSIGLTVGVGSAIRLLADFGQQMSTVAAITQATGSDLKNLSDEAQRLGATTRFTATQAAEGMAYLARAGFNTNEVLGATEGTLKLAQAGALDLGRAADIASNVLRGFRLNVDQTARVVDVLALAANSSNTNVEQLGDALKFVAPVASGVGLSLEDTVAAVSELSNAGLQASLAGTGLRRVISELESPSAKTRREIEQLGEQVDRGEISVTGLFAALQKLTEAGVDTGAALEIFGDRGGPAFEVLSTGVTNARSLADALREATGTADRISEVMDDNLNGALLATASALQAIILRFGELGASDYLKNFFFDLAGVFRTVAANAENIIPVINGLAVAIGGYLALQAIPLAIAALRSLALAFLTNPLGAFVTTIGLATAAFVTFSSRVKLSADGSATALDLINREVGRLRDLSVEALDFFVKLITGFKDDLDTFNFSAFVEQVAIGLDGIGSVFKGTFAAVKVTVQNALHAIVQFFVDAFNDAQTQLENFLTGVNAVGRAITGRPITADVLVDIPDLQNGFAAAGQTAGEAFNDALYQGYVNGKARNFVLNELAATEQDAQERAQRAAAAAAAAGGAPGGVPGETGGAAGEPLGGGRAALTPGLSDRNSALERELANLRSEADVLREVGVEREVLAKKLDLEEQLRTTLRETNKNLSEEEINSLATLSEAETEQVRALVETNHELTIRAGILDDLEGPTTALREGQAVLNDLLDEGRITTEQFNDQLRTLELRALDADRTLSGGLRRGLLQISEQFGDVSKLAEDFLVDAFGNAEDALVQFARTGKLSVRDLFDSIIADLTRLQVRKFVTAPLADALGLGEGGGSGGGAASFVKNLLGFAGGGSFKVGSGTGVPGVALPGVDNRLVAFRARDGETVSVTPKGGGATGGVTVVANFNFTNSDSDSFMRNQSQIEARLGTTISRAVRRNT